MIDQLIDNVDAMAARFRVSLSILSVALFVFSCAGYAGFVRLPNFQLFHGWVAIAFAASWNALWWGVLYPRAEKRRQQRSTLDKTNG